MTIRGQTVAQGENDMEVPDSPWIPLHPCPLTPHELFGRKWGPQLLTDLSPLRGDPGHGRGALGQFRCGPLRDAQGAAIGGIAEDGEADLLLGDGSVRPLALSRSLLLPGRLLVEQVAYLHDIPNDLHRTRQVLLPAWQVILGLLQIGCWRPALFA